MEDIEKIQEEIEKQIEEETGIKREPKSETEMPPPAKENAAPEPPKEEVTPPVEKPKENEAPPAVEKEFWEKDLEEPPPVAEDWKTKFEGTNTEYTAFKTKVESNKVTKKLLELIDSPNFDLPAFLETQIAKKIDFTKVPVDALYKASLEADTVANYTPEEIEDLWKEKAEELKANPVKEKALKSELVRQFQSQQPEQSDEEPELIKLWKSQKEEQDTARQKSITEHKQVLEGISKYTETLVGQKMGGVEITKEDVDAVNQMTNIDYYKDANGKVSETRIAIDRLKARMWDKSQKYYKSDAVIEAKKAITRPSTSTGGGDVGDTDQRPPNEKILDEVAQGMGLKSHKDLIL